MRAKYFSQNFSPPLKKFLRAPLTSTFKTEYATFKTEFYEVPSFLSV